MTHNASTNAAPRVLLCWAGRPGYIPPPALSPDQVTIYSHHDRELPGLIDPLTRLADTQDYDLELVAERLGGKSQFDLVCVSSGANSNNQPRNLGAFDCPRVLLVGDTHHIINNPIGFVLDYIQSEQYDIVMSMHSRDHNKWFTAFGERRTGWIPGLTAQNVETPFQHTRRPVVGFVGSWRLSHPRRKAFIGKIRRDGLPFDHQRLSRAQSSEHYARSLISFNCSLNGDLNMRIHEILSSGGMLLTDRLAPASGLDDMLEEGRDYIAYDSYPDFRTKAESLLANPQKAVAIAASGLRTYQQHLKPDYLASRFLDWALDGSHPQYDYPESLAGCDGVALRRRLEIYECAQRLQLWNERTEVLFRGPRARKISADLDGLIRVVAVPEQSNSRQKDWKMIVVDRDIHGHDAVSAERLFIV